MLKPPALPQAARIAGKIAVGTSWIFCILAPLMSASTLSQNIAQWLAVFLVGSHIVELVIYGAFLKAAQATPADYAQTFLFGIFHSGGLQEK